ncbi:MAG: hypothetical protein DWH82_06395 [Planctomycetota bacterium]|nr:MAG: hypothetical protein DWH82_06395 [Planctomycetota bacterium]
MGSIPTEVIFFVCFLPHWGFPSIWAGPIWPSPFFWYQACFSLLQPATPYRPVWANPFFRLKPCDQTCQALLPPKTPILPGFRAQE